MRVKSEERRMSWRKFCSECSRPFYGVSPLTRNGSKSEGGRSPTEDSRVPEWGWRRREMGFVYEACVWDREMQWWRDTGGRTERKPHTQLQDSKARRLSSGEIICRKNKRRLEREGKGEERRSQGERRAQPVVTRTKWNLLSWRRSCKWRRGSPRALSSLQ